jgi:RimJ/RimL family protein N-acetyltransferase
MQRVAEADLFDCLNELRPDALPREAGCYAATLGVNVENERARALYERLGYLIIGERSSEVSMPGVAPFIEHEHTMGKYFTA